MTTNLDFSLPGGSSKSFFRMPDFRRISGAFAAAICSVALSLAVPAIGQDISPAEKLLFQTNHLENVKKPRSLRYAYVQKGTARPGFNDEVVVDVGEKNPDGTLKVTARFLSGEREVPLTALTDAQGNPAVLGFLERDIREMKTLTGGQPNYFRKRIRLALVESAKVEPVSVSYNGENVKGRKVVIQPYLNDPMQHKFQQFVDKRYVFIFSDQVPGGLYQIQTTIPDKLKGTPENGGSQLIEETMTLTG